MSSINNVHRLRQKGYKVRVNHYRIVSGAVLPCFSIRENNFGSLVEPKGGRTEVTVEKDGIVKSGVAFCSKEDVFSYKEGVRIALERALSCPDKYLEPQKALKKIQSRGGKFFKLIFKKRTNGEIRHMVARLGVNKGQKNTNINLVDTKNNLISVYDMQKKGYRSVPLDSIITVK